jgi:hypothetical protein
VVGHAGNHDSGISRHAFIVTVRHDMPAARVMTSESGFL